MRVPSSKSLMSPGHPRDPAAPSLSASLSRRLRSSGSVKGAQSPMFPAGVAAGGRRKGCAFEAAEPSSPKVTCIGQVRVKSKKKHRVKGKAVGAVPRSRSQRGSGGEASFRRAAEQEKSGEGEVDGGREGLHGHKNQGWVYQLPVSICEALRAFGSELSCFLPCGGGRSFCSSTSTRDDEEKVSGGIDGEKRTTSSSSCGPVFARWLMAIQESEEGKRREVVGLVVEERERADMGLLAEGRERREVDGFEVQEGENGGGMKKKEEMLVVEGEMEKEARVSVCIPPRNALLLMRCRSDPVRMAALASRVWDSPAVRTQVVEELDADEEGEEYGEELVVGKNDCGEDIESDAEETLLETGQSEEKIAEDEESLEELVKEVGLNGKSELEGNNEAEEEMRDHDPEDTRKEEPEDEGIPTKESIAGPVEALRNQSKKAEEEEEEEEEEKQLEENLQLDKGEPEEREPEEEDAETKGRGSSSCSSTRQKVDSRSANCFSKAKETAMRLSFSSKEKERRRHSFSSEEARRHSFSTEKEARRASFSIDMEGRRRRSFSIDKEDMRPEDNKAIVRRGSVIPSTEDEKENKSPKVEEARETVVPDEPNNTHEILVMENKGAVEGGERQGESKGELPDCLLLMMYEPKLSMEVSKETWVCSTDFLRWRPHHPHHRQIHPTNPKPKDDTCEKQCSEDKGLRTVEDSTQQPAQPSLSLPPPPPPPAPAPPSATAIKLKLLNPANAAPQAPPYGPFVLTRCKSEPMRSSARLAPGACFWKSRHQPIGAIGF